MGERIPTRPADANGDQDINGKNQELSGKKWDVYRVSFPKYE